jgi:hypothetical protein
VRTGNLDDTIDFEGKGCILADDRKIQTDFVIQREGKSFLSIYKKLNTFDFHFK